MRAIYKECLYTGDEAKSVNETSQGSSPITIIKGIKELTNMIITVGVGKRNIP